MGNDERTFFTRILVDTGSGYMAQTGQVSMDMEESGKKAAMKALGAERVSMSLWRFGYDSGDGRVAVPETEDLSTEALISACALLDAAEEAVGGLGDYRPRMKQGTLSALSAVRVPGGQASALVRKHGLAPMHAVRFMASAVKSMNPYAAHCLVRRCLESGHPLSAFEAIGFPARWWRLSGNPGQPHFESLSAVEKASWRGFLAPKSPKVSRVGSKRFEKLVRRPDGATHPSPKWVRCYDDRKSADRYTVIYAKRKECGETPYVGMSAHPFHPLGVGMHGTCQGSMDADRHGFVPAIGRKTHLGWRIPFEELPADCVRLVWSDYADYWGIENPLSPIDDSRYVWR